MGMIVNRYVPNQPFGWACFWKIIKNKLKFFHGTK